jgi:hypothetical protein
LRKWFLGTVIKDLPKYENCLRELRKRASVIADFVGKKYTTGSHETDIEFICLQFRIVIELIALSSLVANKGEYSKQLKKFETQWWRATKIFKGLEIINPKFYPEPRVKVEREDNIGRRYIDIETMKGGFLTRKKACEVYVKCGSYLHSSNPFKRQDPFSIQGQFPKWIEETNALLNNFSVVLDNNRIVILSGIESRMEILLRRGEQF